MAETGAKSMLVQATCTSKGSHIEVVKCSACGEELWRETAIEPALGHDWGAWQTVTPATEDEAGLLKRECSRCEAEETRKIPKLPHVHVLTRIPAEAATCDTAGVKEFWECDCGAWFFDAEGKREVDDTADLVIEPAGHTPGAIETTDVVEATCGIDSEYIAWLENFVDAEGIDSYYDYGEFEDDWAGCDHFFSDRHDPFAYN